MSNFKLYYKADGKEYPYINGQGEARVYSMAKEIVEDVDRLIQLKEKGMIESFRFIDIT